MFGWTGKISQEIGRQNSWRVKHFVGSLKALPGGYLSGAARSFALVFPVEPNNPNPTMKAACLSHRGRTFRAVLFLPIPFVSAAPYLFGPGHGLTERTGTSIGGRNALLDECEATGPWMKIIEIAYDWGDLQGSDATNDNPGAWNTANLNKIVYDATELMRPRCVQ